MIVVYHTFSGLSRGKTASLGRKGVVHVDLWGRDGVATPFGGKRWGRGRQRSSVGHTGRCGAEVDMVVFRREC